MTYPTQTNNTIADAAFINDLADDLEALQTAWAAYTPTWAGSSGNPALGNGTLVGASQKSGQVAHVRMRLVIGSTTTMGSGVYSWLLPYTAVGVQQAPPSTVQYYDLSTGQYQSGQVAIDAGASVFTLLMDLGNASGYLARAGTTTISPASGDILVVGFTYEPA
ncbi:MAG: hypothetical protein LC798_10865 [Chloroflexi bacterium]|nr:hypothetical protein [Chloroflexota bacterium]